MSLQDNDSRELRNKLSDLNVKLANIKADLMHLTRQKDNHQLKVRRLRKKIKREKMELELLNKQTEQFEKKEFELENEQRFLKKKVEKAIAQINPMEI